jgi:ribulose-5-phosphate 4-epimerase/fuculose-1-phosphate aldolase
MTDDGYIKFNCDWKETPAVSMAEIGDLNTWRDKLYSLGLIGAYPDGVGFGNISIRQNLSFIITGSATGNLRELNARHYSKVVLYDLDKNYLKCIGETKASSESMTHAAIYNLDSKINAVIHVHNLELWEKLLYKVPTTSKESAYGTPEIAREMIRVISASKTGIVVTEGHKEGIFTYGKDLDEAGKILMSYYLD